MAEDLALTLLRVSLGVVMIAHGFNHWRGGGRIAGTARWFEGLGLQRGTLQAWASVVTEIGAGCLLILGLLTPLACAAVVGVMAVAGLLAHRPNGFFVFKDGWEYVLVLALVAISLAMLGPGRWSVDAVVGLGPTGWPAGLLAAAMGGGGALLLLAAYYRPQASTS